MSQGARPIGWLAPSVYRTASSIPWAHAHVTGLACVPLSRDRDFLGVIGNLSDGRAWYGGYDYQDPTATIAFDEAFFDRADDHDDHICHDHHHGFSGNNSHYDWDFA